MEKGDRREKRRKRGEKGRERSRIRGSEGEKREGIRRREGGRKRKEIQINYSCKL